MSTYYFILIGSLIFGSNGYKNLDEIKQLTDNEDIINTVETLLRKIDTCENEKNVLQSTISMECPSAKIEWSSKQRTLTQKETENGNVDLDNTKQLTDNEEGINSYKSKSLFTNELNTCPNINIMPSMYRHSIWRAFERVPYGRSLFMLELYVGIVMMSYILIRNIMCLLRGGPMHPIENDRRSQVVNDRTLREHGASRSECCVQ